MTQESCICQPHSHEITAISDARCHDARSEGIELGSAIADGPDAGKGGKVNLGRLAMTAILALAMAVSPALGATLGRPAPDCPRSAAHSVTPGAGATAILVKLTAGDLDLWLDRFMPCAVSRREVSGAVVVVVKDDQILFAKGYGYADTQAHRPIDPETTLFRVASVSKLFTWTAVMQQVELGRLNLDADINTYLDFRIPDTWPAPITLRNLMTHTSGFEEASKNTYAADAGSMPALGVLLKRWVPERMYPPGKIVAYSNYGAALAGYIVERVSRERFEDYVAHHILTPLGMRHATFVQPVPPNLTADLSKGYIARSLAPSPFELVELRPAGGLSASGADMARFMMAHLGNGAFRGSRILEPGTAIAMHSEAFRPDPAMPGMALGFWHLDRNGHVVVAHTGDTVVFHSGLYLVLDAHTGLFVSENTGGDGEYLPRDVFQAFMDRYFPAPRAPESPTLQTALADGQAVAGTYENSRRADSNFMIADEIFNERTVRLNPDATISLSGSTDSEGHERRWREVAPFRWREVNGAHFLDAQMANGAVAAIATDIGAPTSVLVPATFWRSGAWNVPLFLVTLGVLALTALLWPVNAGLRWFSGRPFRLAGRAALAHRLIRVVALADLVFLCGWAWFLSYADSHVQIMDSRIDWWLRTLQVIGALGAIGTIAALHALACSLRDPPALSWQKASNAIVVLACMATVWFAFSLKLLSWSLNY
jgi:CubicO group peptidase (beta-lactamase class C family)